MTGRSPEAKKRRARDRKRIIRAEVTAADAEKRTVVRLPDGRTARLLSVHPSKGGRSKGRKARVLLASGACLSVALEDLVAYVGPPSRWCARCGVREPVPLADLCRRCRYYDRGNL